MESLNPFDDSEEYNVFMDMFSDLLNALISRDLMGALECGESMAALESREKQKAFCTFAAECLRKIFLFQQNLQQIAGTAQQEQEFYMNMSGRCGRKFCSKSVADIEKVVAMIDRNVSSKILFTDLVNRMFLNI